MLALGSYTINFAAIAGGDVKVSGLVEGEVPNIFGARFEVDGGSPGGIGRGMGGVFVFIPVPVFILILVVFFIFILV